MSGGMRYWCGCCGTWLAEPRDQCRCPSGSSRVIRSERERPRTGERTSWVHSDLGAFTGCGLFVFLLFSGFAVFLWGCAAAFGGAS